MVHVALPEASSVAVPITLLPCLKMTVPAGVPDAGAFALTVAVNVTGWPYFEGLGDETILTVVLALLTCSMTAEEVLELKLAFPLYTAVIECAPTGSERVENLAYARPHDGFRATVARV